MDGPDRGTLGKGVQGQKPCGHNAAPHGTCPGDEEGRRAERDPRNTRKETQVASYRKAMDKFEAGIVSKCDIAFAAEGL